MKFSQKTKLIFQICFRKQRIKDASYDLSELIGYIYEGLLHGLTSIFLLMALPFLLIYKAGKFIKPLFWELFIWDSQKFEEASVLFDKYQKRNNL